MSNLLKDISCSMFKSKIKDIENKNYGITGENCSEEENLNTLELSKLFFLKDNELLISECEGDQEFCSDFIINKHKYICNSEEKCSNNSTIICNISVVEVLNPCNIIKIEEL